MPGGEAQNIAFPKWKREMINMDFITGLLRTRRQHDLIWVTVDQMTKSAHFLSVNTTNSTEDYARLYIQEIVQIHGVHVPIVLDRGSQFTSQFRKSFQKGLCSKVNLSTTFHPRTDGQEERTIQTLEDMSRACFIDSKALYGQRSRSLIGWFEVGEVELIGPDLVHQPMEKVSPMKDVMRFRKKGKLSPRYIGPYRISKRVGNLAYELELPSQLATVHLVFHISMLKKYMGDPSIIVPTKNIGIKDDLSYEEMPVQILNYQVRKLRTKEVASVKVL
ncbi:uncharacterized protein LOC125816351 [Solanum verrucosum]|uniref:uncharacterized protein LOC125816351 n=1 Tax=Solanum verrucosum TaxID=315347 RepID=UPI0020D0876B|nr:uncharacterized protein LOC125816351 [Solanum verrucosum]